MAYEQKPGQGSMFKNDKANENEKAPIYKGTCTTPDGKKWELAAWVRESQSGVKYFSIVLKEPFQQQPCEYRRPSISLFPSRLFPHTTVSHLPGFFLIHSIRPA